MKASAPAILGQGSMPLSLTEQLTMKEVLSNGLGHRIMQGKIKDPLFPEHLFAKMEYTRRGLDGSKVTVHYWKNLQTGSRGMGKFKRK